ncbi:MAG: zinc-binding dehydrogenase, partial [Spirochaetales bacterium]|nr:zinc-binding dehydrogenase [Spirochaetales bacterium]
MRLMKYEGQSNVSIIEKPDPVPGPFEVVIETAVSAICGSELHTYRGEESQQANSGHEAVGTVVEIGEGVSGMEIGLRVGAERLETARSLGASDVLDATECDPVDHIRMLTDGAGADVCVEATGRPEAALACFNAVRTAGTVVFNGEQGPIPISPSDQFIRRDITAVGSWFYHFSEIDQILELCRNGLPINELVSHRYPFTEAGAAFERFSSGRSAKVLL